MNIGAKAVNLRKVQQDAENHYRGGFFCCEAVMAAMRENFELDVPEDVIGMASAMSVGAGRSGCAARLTEGFWRLGCFLEELSHEDLKIQRLINVCHILTNFIIGLKK